MTKEVYDNAVNVLLDAYNENELFHGDCHACAVGNLMNGNQEWKLVVSTNLDALTHTYEKITNKFRDIDNYILKDAKSKDEFIEKVKKQVEELPETSQQIFLSFLQSID